MLEPTATSEASEATRREEMSLRGGLHAMHFHQCHVTLVDAIAPARLRQLLELVRAAAELVDDAVWEVNEGAMMTLPSYCDQCDTFGHVAAVCPHYNGQERTEASYAPSAVHAYGHYTLRREGLNRSLERVISVNGRSWNVKKATGDDNNCLIDTLRQMLKTDGIPWFPGYLERVRHDLATEGFAAENEFQVREPSHLLGANYLEFLEHARAVVRRLVYHAPDQDHLGINRHARCWEPERIKFVCVWTSIRASSACWQQS
jgi:hypothetical protein